jgi:phosphatidate cytidylyltransferase
VKNLYTRTITGIFFVAIIIGSLILHPLAFAAVIFVIMITGFVEFFRLVKNGHIFPQYVSGIFTGSIVYLIPVLAAQGLISPKYLALLPFLIFVLFVAELFRDKPNTMQNLAFTIFPLAYLSIPLTTLVLLMSPLVVNDQPHWHIIFGFFTISWSYDTFAYLTGMWLGKHKLFEKISPKKTWEGTFGGTIFGLIAAYILSVFFIELSVTQWLAAGLIIIVTGTFGDLSESLLKRKFSVKDSGNFFPGHGGVLDRFDSVLFAAPALFCYLILLNL